MKRGKKRRNNSYSVETTLIYGRAKTPHWDYSHHLVPPITSSCTYRLDSAQRGAQGFVEFAHTTDEVAVKARAPIYIYDRLGDPTKDMLEETLARAESGAASVTFTTGMAAVSGILGCLTATGDEIVAHRMLYGCTYSLLTNWYPRYRIGVKFANLTSLDHLRHSISRRTRVVYFESPVNPTMQLIDIRGVCDVVAVENRKRSAESRIYVVIDNTFATPFCQRPIELGADFVLHSLTKNIGGFGTDMGGAVIGPAWSRDRLLLYRKDFGGALAAKSAWPLLVYGLPTLSLRTRHQERSAIEIARFLESEEHVDSVTYPGLTSHPQYEVAKRQMLDYDGNFAPGIMIHFTVKGRTPKERRARGERVINYLAKNAYTVTLAVSLGNIRTLVEHPGSMTHAAIPPEEQVKKGIDPGGIRLSVGLERVDDIIHDLHRALGQLR